MFKPNFIKALCSDEVTCFVLKMFSNMCHHTESTCWCDNCVALVRVSWNLTLTTEAFLMCALPFGKVDCISLELFHCTMFCRWKCFRCLLSVPAIDALLFVLVSNLKTIIKNVGRISVIHIMPLIVKKSRLTVVTSGPYGLLLSLCPFSSIHVGRPSSLEKLMLLSLSRPTR